MFEMSVQEFNFVFTFLCERRAFKHMFCNILVHWEWAFQWSRRLESLEMRFEITIWLILSSWQEETYHTYIIILSIVFLYVLRHDREGSLRKQVWRVLWIVLPIFSITTFFWNPFTEEKNQYSDKRFALKTLFFFHVIPPRSPPLRGKTNFFCWGAL